MNDSHHAFESRKNFGICETQHFVTAGRQPAIANLVPPQTRLEVVRVAINLDHELRGMTHEIDDICAHWRLTAKLQSVDVAGLDVAPQQRLGARHR
jgi:hypothetical protein